MVWACIKYSPDNKVELSISAEAENQIIDEKIELIRKLALDYDSIMANLQNLIFKSFNDTHLEKQLDQIKEMYFLTAVSLNSDSKTWWLTMEPTFEATTPYNHFKRFTMVDREIVGMNFNITSNT